MTISERADSGAFQGLFQAEYGHEVDRCNRWNPLVDVMFLRPAQFSFTEGHGSHHTGRFLAEVETSDGHVGDTTGPFRLHPTRGLDDGEIQYIIDTVTLTVEIESIPGM